MKNLIKTLVICLLAQVFLACESAKSENADVGPSSNPSSGGTGKGGSLARFAIVDQTMYYVDNGQIASYDVTNAENPRLVSKTNINSNTVETIYGLDEYLYLGSSNGMFIYSIASPHNPRYLSMATHASGCDPVVSDGKYAYVTVRNTSQCSRWRNVNLLEVYDVKNPTQPKLIHTENMKAPVGMALDGNLLFVCDGNEIVVFNVSNPSNPLRIKTIPSTAYDIIIDGSNFLTVTEEGIEQYLYDRQNISLTYRSKIKTKHF